MAKKKKKKKQPWESETYYGKPSSKAFSRYRTEEEKKEIEEKDKTISEQELKISDLAEDRDEYKGLFKGISSIRDSDDPTESALNYDATRYTNSFFDQIKAVELNADTIYEDRRNQSLPGKIGDYNTASTKALRKSLESVGSGKLMDKLGRMKGGYVKAQPTTPIKSIKQTAKEYSKPTAGMKKAKARTEKAIKTMKPSSLGKVRKSTSKLLKKISKV